MSSVAAPAISAKCRAMFSRLLGVSEYETLLGRSSVAEIATHLKRETPYAYVLRRTNENDTHRGELEQVFAKSLYYDYEKLLKYSDGAYSDAIMANFTFFEIEELKILISFICSGRRSKLSVDDLSYMRKYSDFDVRGVAEASNMENLVENLRNTRYHSVLLPFATREAPDFLSVDTALDLLAHRTKIEAYGKLKGACKTACLDIYGQQVDTANISFIHRMKKLYKFTPAALFSNLVPYTGRLRESDLREMAMCDGSRALLDLEDLIAKSPYAALFPKRYDEWETLRANYFYDLHKRNLRRHAMDVNAALAYLHMKAADIKNIITVIEGARYALPTARVSSFLVGPARLSAVRG